MSYNRHRPRPVQTHTGAAEENTDDSQDNEGYKDERDDKDHALFGNGFESFYHPVIQQDKREQQDG